MVVVAEQRTKLLWEPRQPLAWVVSTAVKGWRAWPSGDVLVTFLVAMTKHLIRYNTGREMLIFSYTLQGLVHHSKGSMAACVRRLVIRSPQSANRSRQETQAGHEPSCLPQWPAFSRGVLLPKGSTRFQKSATSREPAVQTWACRGTFNIQAQGTLLGQKKAEYILQILWVDCELLLPSALG